MLSAKLPKSKKVFDNTKVTDHHAIIPTGQLPNMLMGDEKKLYHLIARRFIAVFYPDCEFTTTTVTASVDNVGFKASGKVIVSPGWRAIYDSDTEKQESDTDESIMPAFTPGESGSHEPSLLKKATQPPKYYTEGTLLRAMESAGKMVEEEELREAMKENGIGRPSTRASIIETLFKRGYLVRERKNIHATKAGIDLIGIIKDDLLKSAKLTGIWENKLRRIERGEYNPAEFIEELKELINRTVLTVLSDNGSQRIIIEAQSEKKKLKPTKDNAGAAKKPRRPRMKSVEEITCPKCGAGHIIAGRTAFGCSRYKEGCDLRLSYNEYDKALTPAKLIKKIEKNYGTGQ